MKFLAAHGPAGRNAKVWNWCAHGELVCTHGIVCCSSKDCGCDRSFVGTVSNRSCTFARVVEIGDAEHRKARAKFRETLIEAWGGPCSTKELLASVLGYAMNEFDRVPGYVMAFPVGTIVGVKLAEDAIMLHKVI